MRCLPLIVLAGALLAVSAASAQDRPDAGGTKRGAARPGGTTAKAQPSRSWAKLCETPTTDSRDLLGKRNAVGVKTCLIHHEQIDRMSGAVQVAAGVQQAEGRQTLIVKLSADADTAQGVGLAILPRDIWRKLQASQQVPLETSRVRRLTLAYSSCNAEGCIAETKATPRLLADLKSGGGIVIIAILKGRQAFAYAVSLSGFREAYDGPPVDSARFHAARAELLRQIRERQKHGLQPPGWRPEDEEGVVPPRRPDGQDI
jgi:invasion protein IalB